MIQELTIETAQAYAAIALPNADLCGVSRALGEDGAEIVTVHFVDAEYGAGIHSMHVWAENGALYGEW